MGKTEHDRKLQLTFFLRTLWKGQTLHRVALAHRLLLLIAACGISLKLWQEPRRPACAATAIVCRLTTYIPLIPIGLLVSGSRFVSATLAEYFVRLLLSRDDCGCLT